MGKSKSIAEHQQQNQEFQNYIKEIQQGLTEKARVHGEAFSKEIEEYYGNELNDVIRIGSDEKYDFRQIDEVTLDGLKDAILRIVDAIFPGPKQDQGMDEKSKKAASDAAGYRGMAAAVATNIIIGAMNILDTSTEITFNYGIKSESICPGLTLHILVANDAYRDKRWFNNTEIVESYIRYELIYSYKRVAVEMDIGYFNAKLADIAKLEESVSVLKGKYAEALIDPNVSDEMLESMENRIKGAEDLVEQSRAEVKKAIATHNANLLKGVVGAPSFSSKRQERIAAYIQSAGDVVHE